MIYGDGILFGRRRGNAHLSDLGVDGGIKSKYIFKEQGI
jgi:hypothetical protein